MSDVRMFHIGIIVPNMAEAIDKFAKVLDLTFTEPATVHVTRDVDGGVEGPLELQLAFSHEGPPYFELLEATGDGLYSQLGLHHIGLWESDNAARRDHLVAAGVNVTTIQYTPDGEIIALYSDPVDLFGARIEFVDRESPRADGPLDRRRALDGLTRRVHGSSASIIRTSTISFVERR